MRRPLIVPTIESGRTDLSRRRLLLAGCCFLTGSANPVQRLWANESEILVNPGQRSMKAWHGDRQVVIAYQQGPDKGKPCRQLAIAGDELAHQVELAVAP